MSTTTCTICGTPVQITPTTAVAIRESRAQVIHGARNSGHYVDGPYYAPLPR